MSDDQTIDSLGSSPIGAVDEHELSEDVELTPPTPSLANLSLVKSEASPLSGGEAELPTVTEPNEKISAAS